MRSFIICHQGHDNTHTTTNDYIQYNDFSLRDLSQLRLAGKKKARGWGGGGPLSEEQLELNFLSKEQKEQPFQDILNYLSGHTEQITRLFPPFPSYLNNQRIVSWITTLNKEPRS